MSLSHILLGLLAEPASGYGLRKEFEGSLNHFWSANLSQIYPTLERLEQEGLVEAEIAPPGRGPARRLYRRTQAGTHALEAWLAAGPEFNPQRLSWLAQIYFLGVSGTDALARDFLAGTLARLEAQRARMIEIERNWAASGGGLPEAPGNEDYYPCLTLKLGLAVADARIAWCRAALARLDRTVVSAS